MIGKHTISKIWKDHEILFKDPETGEIHLKPGVHRKNYGDWINPYRLESHINLMDLKKRQLDSRVEELGINESILDIHE